MATEAECQLAWNTYVRANHNAAEAARQLGLSPSTLKDRVRRAKLSGLTQDAAIRDAMSAVGTQMVPRLAWAKTKSEDGTSYSVLLKPEEYPDDMLARIREAFEGMDPAPPIPAPEHVAADLLTLYPLFDVHFGMMAWSRETGDEDYDIKLAADQVAQALPRVAALCPASDSAVLLIGGDFFHADDSRAETPQSKHRLDVDGRHMKVLDAGIRVLAWAIDWLRARHRHVIVRIMRGNHDEHSHMVLTFALSERYRDCDRVTVGKDPRDLFHYQWGRTLIAGHHGDKAKPEQLAMLLADVVPYWSQTRHRYVYTGHLHHDRARDIAGIKWESLRAFAPMDAWAAGQGYSSRRSLQAMTYHKDTGLVLRAYDPVTIERSA